MYTNLCDVIFFFFAIVTGRKGGHKGRMRTYTSPEEIDAQMKAEKERKKVGKDTGHNEQFSFCTFLHNVLVRLKNLMLHYLIMLLVYH